MPTKFQFFALAFWLGLVQGGAAGEVDSAASHLPRPIRVLLIGDATVGKYAPFTRDHLEGFAEVYCISEGAESTEDALLHLDSWLGTMKWNVIRFNFGLWGASVAPSGRNRLPLDKYGENLKRLATHLKTTGAQLLWAPTVPVDLPTVLPSEIARYNTVANKVMESNGVRIVGLSRSAASNQETLTRESLNKLGERVANEIYTTVVFGPIEDDPKLPNILLIGDSISIGYTVPLRSLLAGKANVHRIPCNGGSTAHSLPDVKNWLGARKWDVIHFNWGIWDAHIFLDDGSYRVPIAQYRQNLIQLVKQLKSTGARLIWASTTPLQPLVWTSTPPQKPPERDGSLWNRAVDIPSYNAVAKEVMESQAIPIDDLYAAALPQLVSLQTSDGAHFSAKGCWLLARKVADKIESGLASVKDP